MKGFKFSIQIYKPKLGRVKTFFTCPVNFPAHVLIIGAIYTQPSEGLKDLGVGRMIVHGNFLFDRWEDNPEYRADVILKRKFDDLI